MLLKAYKTEIKPNAEQKRKIQQTLGVCRFVYNFFISHNKERYEQGQSFMSGIDFSKWLNNDFIPNNPTYKWIKDVSSKAVKQSIMNASQAFAKFFRKKAGFPRFKRKKDQDVKAYFPKNNKTDWQVERHRVKIPTLGWVRVKEFGYIPPKANVRSGTVSFKAGRYYVSVLVDEHEPICETNKGAGIGIDVGLKHFAVCSNSMVFSNINETAKIKKLEKRLKREQRKLSRKIHMHKQKGGKPATFGRNIRKQITKVQKLHHRLCCIHQDYLNKVINEVVKTKPSFITMEDLNVKGMMKNKHLAKHIQKQSFHLFRKKLEWKCKQHGVELRVATRFYPSSKMCSQCGWTKVHLKLSERVFRCEQCGCEIDRDQNAAINLARATTYDVAC